MVLLRRNRFFILILIIALGLRLYHLWYGQLFFSDVAWYYLQAKNSLFSGTFPLLGITASITWLHQGALWTYLLIPALVLTGFHPLSGSVLIVIFSLVTLTLGYLILSKVFNRSSALVGISLYATYYFSVIHSRLAYHTSPIPLFCLITLGLLIKRRLLLSGLFLGFLYQLHLLTFVFWPMVIIFCIKNRLSPFKILFGFIIGLVPMIFAGPVPVFGIFFWIIKQLFTLSFLPGLNSQSYGVVIFMPILFIFSWLFHRLSPGINLVLVWLIIVLNIYYLFSNSYFENVFPYQITMSRRLAITGQLISKSQKTDFRLTLIGQDQSLPTADFPYRYLWWWKTRIDSSFSGTVGHFLINEHQATVSVLE